MPPRAKMAHVLRQYVALALVFAACAWVLR